jgi:hypothetical protein
LPAALSCAESGDTIKLSESLANQTINVGNNPLMINKDVIIEALGANTKITSTGLRVFEVSNAGNVLLDGMTIVAGTSLTGGALTNQANLTLRNVTIEKNVSVSGATLIHNTGGQLKLEGSCFINQ